jgi:hypothetical protein
MSYKIHSIFIVIIISFIAIQGSEHTKLYKKDDLRTTIKNSIVSAQDCYEKKEYAQAALSARGAREYATINKIPLHIEDNIILHYIAADCHMNLKSPQHAFESFQAIHDIETPYGTICSKTISECLYQKSHAVAQTQQKLSEKLKNEAYNYTIKNLYHNIQQKSSLLINNELLSQYAAFTDKQSKIRKCFFNFLDNSAITNRGFLKTLFILESDTQFADTISLFINSDGKYIIPLLQEKLLNTSQNNACNLHYVLGLLYYYQEKYAEAFSHLTQTAKLQSTDLPTAYKTVRSFFNMNAILTQENALQAFELLKKMCQTKKQIPRNNEALEESWYIFSQYAFQGAQLLVENEHYKEALHFAFLCSQRKETYAIGLEIVTIIHKKLISSSTVDNSILLKSNELMHIEQQIIQKNDLPSLQCTAPIIVHALLHKQISADSLNKMLVVRCVEHSLNHTIYTPQETATLKKIVGDIYYQMQNVEKAYEYDHIDTIFNKASTIFDGVNAGVERNEVTLLIMYSKLLPLTEPHNKKDVRKKAADFLLSPSFINPINDNKVPLINDKDKLCLMNIAYELGSNNPEHLVPLAYNYMYGPQPECKKASEILERTLKTTSSPKAHFALAKAYYLQGPDCYEKAFERFKIMAYTHDKTCKEDEKSLALLYMSLIKLYALTPESIMDAAHYLNDATPLETVCTHSLGELMSEQLYKKLAAYAQKQMEQKNTVDHALEACALFGQLFYERQEVNKNTNRHHLRYQTLASQCLEYATNNHNYRAQLTSVVFDDPQIHAWKKIEYIQTILENTQEEHLSSGYNYFKLFLNKYYPKQIQEKYQYIQYLFDNASEKELHSYLASNFFGSTPLKNEPTYATTNNELAQIFYTDTILKKYSDEFNSFYDDKNNLKEKNSQILKRILNVIYIYSYALMKSDNPKLITTSVLYLKKLLQLSAYQDYHIIKDLLATCYYRLSTYVTNSQLAFGYLKASANLKHEQAVLDITEQYLQNDPLTNNISYKQIADWLQNIHNDNNTNTIDQLIDRLSTKAAITINQAIEQKKNATASFEQTENFLLQEPEKKEIAKQILNTLAQTTHSRFKDLAASDTSTEANDPTFQFLLNNKNFEYRLTNLAVLAHEKQHPHAALLYCTLLYSDKKIFPNDYFGLALKNGIKQKNKKVTLFQDGLFLNMICNLILEAAEQKDDIVLYYIKKQLTTYKINFVALIEYITSFCNQRPEIMNNLNQYPEWKQ